MPVKITGIEKRPYLYTLCIDTEIANNSQ